MGLEVPAGSRVGYVRTNVRTALVLHAHNPIDVNLARTIAAERAKLHKEARPGIGTRAV
jgi:hypothetical protein